MVDNVQYSVLLADTTIDLDRISTLLSRGIKILCFTTADEIRRITESKLLGEGHFLKLYTNKYSIKLEIIDGKYDIQQRQILDRLASGDSSFNIEQYLVEHAASDKHLCVEAGAGTGKTTVMIDRIMFLFHTYPGFDFSKVAMITFTNKATDNMRHRLLKELNYRYEYTHDIKYLSGLESVSQVSISTIHSFFRKVIIEVGPLMGYGVNLQMRSYAQEKKEILRDLMNESYGKKNSQVQDVFGLPMLEIEKLASDYWNKMENNGLTDDEIEGLSWGNNSNPIARKIQAQLEFIFGKVDSVYNETKLRNNAISMKDIIHELGRVVHLDEAKEYITSSFDFIFCDEFQDTDIVQIKTISLLTQIYGCKLFVVGDIKQSIYRFRGATDAAFQRLIDRTEAIEFQPASLTKNYRTASDIMNRLDPIFLRWNSLGYIRYEEKDRLTPKSSVSNGIYKQYPVTKALRPKKVMNLIKKIMVEDKSAIVTVLTRTNKELQQIREWCEQEKDIPYQIKEKGSFFTSPAVLDLCAVLEALLYDGVPMYLWNVLQTPYLKMSVTVESESMLQADGNTFRLLNYFYSILKNTKWETYCTSVKERPILSVIREIVDECDPVNNYARMKTADYRNLGKDNDYILSQVILDTRQYKANLSKLLQHLQEYFGTEFCSLYDVCNYLRIRIATDRNEEQADTDRDINRGYVEGYTVHSAKGLEFDHVLIPFMVFPMISDFRSEILISEDNTQVGWIYRPKGTDRQEDIFSNNYSQLKKTEDIELIRDETRLLYVAMTRAIKSLYCFPTRRPGNHEVSDWSSLLAEDEDDAYSL